MVHNLVNFVFYPNITHGSHQAAKILLDFAKIQKKLYSHSFSKNK